MVSRVLGYVRWALSRQNRAYTGSLALHIAGSLLGLVVQTMLAQWLRASGYGRLSTIAAIASILALLCTLGTSTAALRYVPHFEEANDPGSAARFVGFSVATTVIASSALAAVFFVGCVFTGLHLTVGQGVAGAVFLVASALQQSCTDLARLSRRFAAAYSAVLILKPVAIAVPVGLFLATGATRSVTVALLAMTLGTVLGLVIQARVMVSRFGRVALGMVRPTREWLRTSPAFVVISASQLILAQVDLLAVSAFLSSRSVGLYSAALKASAVLTLPFVAVNAVIRPSISAAASRADGRQEALELTMQSTLWIGLSTTVLALPMLIWPNVIMDVFGSSFDSGRFALQMLAIGQVGVTFMGPSASLMIYMDRRREAIIGFVVSTVLAAVLCGVGAKVDGINGAAVASMVSYILGGAAMYLLTWRYLGMRVSIVEAIVPRLRQRAV
jgi:O-antigen/teichoic acid export membrane protein